VDIVGRCTTTSYLFIGKASVFVTPLFFFFCLELLFNVTGKGIVLTHPLVFVTKRGTGTGCYCIHAKAMYELTNWWLCILVKVSRVLDSNMSSSSNFNIVLLCSALTGAET
jgi:hypothetical protein